MTAPVTIDHCGRTVAASVVAFDIQWSGELPAGHDLTWAVRVVSPDGTGEVELGHRRTGQQVAQYVRDLTTGRTHQVEPDADLDATGITARFPADVVGLAVEWPTWRAVIEVDGEDVTTTAVAVSS